MTTAYARRRQGCWWGGRPPRRRRRRNGDISTSCAAGAAEPRRWRPARTTGSPDDLVELEDRQQDREDDGEHDAAHGEDEQRLEQGHERGDPAVELAALLGGGALEQLAESPARLAACDHVHEDRREQLRGAQRAREARPLPHPPRAPAHASSSARRIGTFATTPAPARNATSSGTRLPTRIARVAASRAVLSPRWSGATSGSRSNHRCQRSRRRGTASAARTASTAPASASTTNPPYTRRKFDSPISARVSNGRVWLVFWNTCTTCGTTYTSRPVTTTSATIVTSAGYTNASRTLPRKSSRSSV